MGWSFESLGLFSFDLVFFWVLAFGFAAAAFLSLLRLSLAGVFGVCTFPFGSFFRLPLFVGCPTMTGSFTRVARETTGFVLFPPFVCRCLGALDSTGILNGMGCGRCQAQ